MVQVTIDLEKTKLLHWKIRPCGIAMPPALFQQFENQAPGVGFQRGELATINGTPVITLMSLAENEIRVAMTPMAWAQLLVEKRREEETGIGRR